MDIVVFGGGLVVNFMVLWKMYGVDYVIWCMIVVDSDVVFVGVFVGVVCWFFGCLIDVFGDL